MQAGAILHGCDNEIMAREALHSVIEKEVRGFQVAETGMWVNRQYPGIGASPDGLLFDPMKTQNQSPILYTRCSGAILLFGLLLVYIMKR